MEQDIARGSRKPHRKSRRTYQNPHLVLITTGDLGVLMHVSGTETLA